MTDKGDKLSSSCLFFVLHNRKLIRSQDLSCSPVKQLEHGLWNLTVQARLDPLTYCVNLGS